MASPDKLHEVLLRHDGGPDLLVPMPQPPLVAVPNPAYAMTVPAGALAPTEPPPAPSDPASLTLEDHTPPSLAKLTPAEIGLLFTHAGADILTVSYPLFAELDAQQFAAVPDSFFQLVGTLLFQNQPTIGVPARVVHRFARFKLAACTAEMFAALEPEQICDLFTKAEPEERKKVGWRQLVQLQEMQHRALPDSYFSSTEGSFYPTPEELSDPKIVPTWLQLRYRVNLGSRPATMYVAKQRVNARLRVSRAVAAIMLGVVILAVVAAVIICIRLTG